MAINRHDMRRWLGDKSLRDFKTESELRQHFEPKGLLPIMGTMYTFDEADEARATAVQMWREYNAKGLIPK